MTHYFSQAAMTIVAVIGLSLSACAPEEPVRIGYLGGLSGRVTDLGVSGLNGVRLAVELRNQQGGIKGRQIELIEEDDQQNPKIARQAFGQLVDRKVAAVIGPMTSAMAIAIVPQANQAQMILMSPTVTTNELSGLDDYFFRVIPTTAGFTHINAMHYYKSLGLRRLKPIHDIRNRSYTESWIKDFATGFSALGGQMLKPIEFSSTSEPEFKELVLKALADKPDGIILLANSVDAAMLTQKIRQFDNKIIIGTSEWAATERLIELGGKSVEGIFISQFFDRDSTQASYLAFRQAYVKRFAQEPGFAGLFAFDSANVIFEALEKKKKDQSLKQALQSRPHYEGAQRSIDFDENGDTQGKTFMVTINNGAFVTLPGSR